MASHRGLGFLRELVALGTPAEGELLIEPDDLLRVMRRHPSFSERGLAAGRAFGLGDLVAAVAQPAARIFDAVTGTNLANCGGCSQRQAKLNAAVPDVTRPFKTAD